MTDTPDQQQSEQTPATQREPQQSPNATATDKEVAKAGATTRAAYHALRTTAAHKDVKEPISRLIAESRGFFNVSPHVVAGAFHGFSKLGVTEVTRAQAKAVIEAWLKSPVGERPDSEDN